MDRDRRGERIKRAYNLLVHGKGSKSHEVVESIHASYEAGITDEFIEPIVCTDDNGLPIATIQQGDVVVFFNFRTDRGRQLTEVLTQRDLPEFGMQKLDLHYVTMTNYDDSYHDIRVIYDKDNITETLGQVLAAHGKTQLRIAETEKYPHVTFFFSGGREAAFEGETRILCNSPKVPTYDLQPEMSAYDITDRLLEVLPQRNINFVCLNFANGDMVGHTGNMNAAILACEAVDRCVERVVTSALENGYTTLLLADHGNCDTMLNPDGSPNTAHTTNPVPLICIDPDIRSVQDGILADIAPTILKLMNVPAPEVMTGKPLI